MNIIKIGGVESEQVDTSEVTPDTEDTERATGIGTRIYGPDENGRSIFEKQLSGIDHAPQMTIIAKIVGDK